MNEFYHVLIEVRSQIKGQIQEERILDLDKDKLIEKVINPYKEGTSLFVKGTSIQAKDIHRIYITKSSSRYDSIVEELKRKEKNSGVIVFGGPSSYELAMWECEDVLDEFISGAPGYEPSVKKVPANEFSNQLNSKKVFIVHGHNEEVKQTISRKIEKFGLEAIILHEQLNKGKTIIEKFLEYSDVSAAIVILSADDFGYAKSQNAEAAKLRARQNVILELGFFIGSLGRERVIALYEGGKHIELPSDISGVIYESYEANSRWDINVAKELKGMGFEIDLNSIL